MNPEFYERMAHYYDLLHAGFTDDLAFFLSAASRRGGRVLELGCGTGRVIYPLAQAGYSVTGLDNSRAMLAIAARKARALVARGWGRLDFIQGDICAPPLRRQSFGLALVAHNTFMHLAPAEALTALKAVRWCLAPNGRLILDLANPFALWQMPGESAIEREQTVEDIETGETILVSSSSRLDEQAQLLQVTWYFDVSASRGGPPLRREVVATDYHFLFPHETERLISDAGLAMTDLIGDYDSSPFEETSPRMIVIAENRAW